MGARSGPRPQTASAVAILAATAAALAAVGALGEREGGRPAGGAGAATALEAEDPAALAELAIELVPEVAAGVAELRGLGFSELPVPRLVDSEHLNELLAEEYRERVGDPAEALAGDEAAARITGLIGPEEGLGGAIEGGGDLAAAAWDPRTDRLYVIADAVGTSPELLELYLAHELVHALEDQHFGLPEPDSASANDDRDLARSALVEGTATAIMVEYAARHIDPVALSSAALGLDTDAAGRLPDVVVETLEWTYLGGAALVDELVRLGDGWGLVDSALRDRLPASTEQVLHPEAYLRNDRPPPVAIAGAPLRSRGWERAEAATLGELATRQLLALGDEGGAARAAAGWNGDRYELWTRGTEPAECERRCRSELALVMRWRWDSAADAREFAAAARRYLDRGLGGSRAGAGAWEIEGGAVALAPGRRATTLAFAPRAGLARAAAGG